VLALLVLLAARFAFQRWSASGSAIVGGILVYPSGEREGGFVRYASGLSGLIVISADSPSAKPIVEQANRALIHPASQTDFIAMFEGAHSRLTTVVGRAEISPYLDKLAAQLDSSNQLAAPWIIGILGFAIGFALLGKYSRQGWVFAAPSALLMAMLFVIRCRACPSASSLFGLDLSVIAAIYFAILAVVGAALPADLARIVFALGLGATVFVQMRLFSESSQICWICATTFGISCLWFGANSNYANETSEQNGSLRKSLLVAGVCAPALLVALFGWLPSDDSAAPQLAFPLAKAKTASFMNRSISALNIVGRSDRPQFDGPTLVVIGSETCAPCRLAVSWAAHRSEYRLILVHYQPQARPSSGVFSEYWLAHRIPGVWTPTLFLVNSNGIIVDEEYGWAQDDRYDKMLAQRFAQALKAQEQSDRLRSQEILKGRKRWKK
jgi:hypothetical protein